MAPLAVAFPKYAYPDEAPTLPGATVLLMSQSPSTGGAAAGGGNGTAGAALLRTSRGGQPALDSGQWPDGDAACPNPLTPLAGVDVTSWLAAGPAWSDALAPGAGLPYSAVAGGSGPGGGIWAVVDIPDFQNQLASYGTHWPVRFLPMLFALGNTSSAAAAAAVQAADGAAAPTLQPALAGMLTIPMSGGGVEDLVFWNSTAPSNSAASGQARRGVAAAGAAAAAAVHLLLA